MPHKLALILVLCGLSLGGCRNGPTRTEVERALSDVIGAETVQRYNEINSLADPVEAAALFELAAQKNPDRIDALRNLAFGLSKLSEPDRSLIAWERVASHPQASYDDRVELGHALVRVGRWSLAETTLALVPESHQTFKKFQLAAILADNRKRWKDADAFYKAAIGFAPNSAAIYNNWGYSFLSRENYKEAERLLLRSLSYDPTLFIAKNNLALARAGQRIYQLPAIDMNQEERAQLLYTMALAAIKLGDTHSGKVLLRESIDSHPRHFEEAVRSLRTIEE